MFPLVLGGVHRRPSGLHVAWVQGRHGVQKFPSVEFNGWGGDFERPAARMAAQPVRPEDNSLLASVLDSEITVL